MRLLICASLVVMFGHAAADAQTPNLQPKPERTGEEIYRAACAACHGPDGKGQPVSVLGFEPPAAFPDFTDCPVSSAEPDLIWLAIVHMGGRVRGESHIMPAFDDILTDNEIGRVVQYLHSLCAEPGWPRGELNFPRAFFTEKAFPENEVVFTVTTMSGHPGSVESRVDYERRIGKRAQYEVGVPFDLEQGAGGQWSRGLGDVNLAYRYTFYDNLSHGSIGAAGAEVTLPTGKETEGLGGGVTIFEAFGMWNQALPGNSFVQFHGGFERPAYHDVEKNSVFWRTAIGRSLAQNRWGRVWVPIVEILGAKELESGTTAEWDLVPQLQATLSIFQHIKASVGLRVPINERDTRRKAAMAYLLWDWGDGGFFELWRAH